MTKIKSKHKRFLMSHKRRVRKRQRREIRPGMLYLDCAGHPVLCTENDGDGLWGISLIDGSSPRGCSLRHCAPERLSVDVANEITRLVPAEERKNHGYVGPINIPPHLWKKIYK